MRVVAALAAAEHTIAVAESLTGGWVSAAITDIPGASAVLRGAVVAYATDLKARLLGVDEEVLRTRGAVDALVARQMAEGVRKRLGADLGLATTGVAGPDPQDGHPPGTVHVGLAWAGGSTSRSTHLAGPRERVRAGAVALALAVVLGHLAETRPGGETAEQGG